MTMLRVKNKYDIWVRRLDFLAHVGLIIAAERLNEKDQRKKQTLPVVHGSRGDQHRRGHHRRGDVPASSSTRAAGAMFLACYNFCWRTRLPGKSGRYRLPATMAAETVGDCLPRFGGWSRVDSPPWAAILAMLAAHAGFSPSKIPPHHPIMVVNAPPPR